ncbi:MAG TPA: Uma2 family endonuclease [Acetobacteraceae bacterium]|nr:Uma2 family endonuclease [Acetobacteraceae bacterium]
MVALRKQAIDRLTVAEFLVWDSGDRSGRRWQLRDGAPEAMAPATEAHGAILSELGALIRNHLLAAGDRCRVITEPGVVPRVRAANNFRIPDLAVTCAPPSRERMIAEPVLLIEILSPSNTDETWDNVWAYTTIPSVTEILVLSSTAIRAELLRRGTDGSWPEQATELAGPDPLHLASIGLELPLASAYRTTTLAAG